MHHFAERNGRKAPFLIDYETYSVRSGLHFDIRNRVEIPFLVRSVILPIHEVQTAVSFQDGAYSRGLEEADREVQ